MLPTAAKIDSINRDNPGSIDVRVLSISLFPSPLLSLTLSLSFYTVHHWWSVWYRVQYSYKWTTTEEFTEHHQSSMLIYKYTSLSAELTGRLLVVYRIGMALEPDPSGFSHVLLRRSIRPALADCFGYWWLYVYFSYFFFFLIVSFFLFSSNQSMTSRMFTFYITFYYAYWIAVRMVPNLDPFFSFSFNPSNMDRHVETDQSGLTPFIQSHFSIGNTPSVHIQQDPFRLSQTAINLMANQSIGGSIQMLPPLLFFFRATAID